MVRRSLHFLLISLIALTLSGCLSASRGKFFFQKGRIPESEWAREVKECRYEAKTATASAPVRVAEYREDRLFVMCLENKGAIYEGETYF